MTANGEVIATHLTFDGLNDDTIRAGLYSVVENDMTCLRSVENSKLVFRYAIRRNDD